MNIGLKDPRVHALVTTMLRMYRLLEEADLAVVNKLVADFPVLEALETSIAEEANAVIRRKHIRPCGHCGRMEEYPGNVHTVYF